MSCAGYFLSAIRAELHTEISEGSPPEFPSGISQANDLGTPTIFSQRIPLTVFYEFFKNNFFSIFFGNILENPSGKFSWSSPANA